MYVWSDRFAVHFGGHLVLLSLPNPPSTNSVLYAAINVKTGTFLNIQFNSNEDLCSF